MRRLSHNYYAYQGKILPRPLQGDECGSCASVLGFPALITGLCQFYGVPIAPNKVIKPPINRDFIKKYCAPRQGQGEVLDKWPQLS